MIPDFPVQKERLLKFWDYYIGKKQKQILGIFANIPTYTHHEGETWEIIRVDGSSSESTYNKFVTVFSIPNSDLPNLTPPKIAKMLDSVVEDLAKQQHEKFFEEILKATEKAGTNVNAKGQPLTKELFLEGLNRIDLSFDQEGKLIPPTIIMHPDAWDKYNKEITNWEKDPKFRFRYQEIINRKREEWYARESRRKLVD
jgi:hypothetical protein